MAKKESVMIPEWIHNKVKTEENTPALEARSGGFSLRIKCDDAACAEDPSGEISRILREVAKKVENGEYSGKCMDINGNTVGSYSFG